MHFRILSIFNYILLIMLLQLSQFSPFILSTQYPPTLKQSPHHCSCPCVMCISSVATPLPILYFTSPWVFCNYLCVLLNPLTSSPFPYTCLPSGNHQNALCLHDSVCSSCLLSLFFWFIFLGTIWGFTTWSVFIYLLELTYQSARFRLWLILNSRWTKSSKYL